MPLARLSLIYCRPFHALEPDKITIGTKSSCNKRGVLLTLMARMRHWETIISIIGPVACTTVPLQTTRDGQVKPEYRSIREIYIAAVKTGA